MKTMKMGLLSLLGFALFACKQTPLEPEPAPVPVAVQSVSLNKTATSMMEGATETLSAVVAPAAAKNKAVSWSASDAAIATVSATGEVTGVKEGTATITATTQEGNKTATCVVTVSKTVVAVQGISLNKTATTIVEGTTETLSATITPATATNQNLTWSSSDATIATVSAAGVVTALQTGTATITVTTQEGNKTATCVVTVPNYIIVNGLKWAKGNLVLNGTDGCQIGAPTDYGLYFHFGSLVGWEGGAHGDGTGAGEPAGVTIKVKPATYSGSTSWPAGYYTEGTTGNRGNNLPATDAPTTGIGDPCRYYLGGTWRTPTAVEWLMLLGTDGTNTNKDVPVKLTGYDLAFPASSYREHSDGSFSTSGPFGFYWSSSVGSATNGYRLHFFSGTVYPQDSNLRSFGCPVRCVSE